MKTGLLSGGCINRRRIPENLLIFTAIIEKNLEYTLNLISKLEDSTVDFKKENKQDSLDKLKLDIKAEILNYPPEYIFKIAVFITFLENIYNSTNEIKQYIECVEKYPPLGFDFFEIAVKISDIIKTKIDSFLMDI